MSLTISSALQVRTYVVVADSGGEKRSFEHRTWHTILGSSIKNMNTLFPKPSQTTFFSQLPYLCVYCTTIDFDLSLIRQLLFCLTKCHIICYLKVCRSAQSHMLVWAIMEKLKLKGFVHPSVHVDQANVAVKMGAPKRDKIMCSTTTIAAGSWRKRVCTVLRIDWQQVWGLLQLLRRPTEESLVLILASVRN